MRDLDKGTPGTTLVEVLSWWLDDALEDFAQKKGTPAAADSVVPATEFDIEAAAGESEDYARADHSHGTPPSPTAESVGADPVGSADAAVAAHVAADIPHAQYENKLDHAAVMRRVSLRF